MADNRLLGKREREALDHENTGNQAETRRVIAARFAKAAVRGGHIRATDNGRRRGRA